MIDLPTKYNTKAVHAEHIGYSKKSIRWYTVASYAIEDAEEAGNKDEIPEYLAQFMTPEHLSFILYTDDVEGQDLMVSLTPKTLFSAVPLKKNGKPSFTDHGMFSRFDWLLDVTTVFDDIPFKCNNLSESSEVSDAEWQVMKAYFEGKGFKVKLSTWEG